MSEPSLFTKIINGEIPSHKIYEDELTFAFLDIHPIQPGQALVVPKHEVQFVWDLEDSEYQALMNTVHKVAQKLQGVFPDKTRVGVHIEGLDVDHAHVKVFPFSTHDEFVHHPNQSVEPNHEALAALAKTLRF